MKHFLLFIFAIIVFCIGSNSEVYALTEVIEENNTFLITYVKSVDENRIDTAKTSPENKFEEKEVSEVEHTALYTNEENDSENIQESSAFELSFFVSMLILMALLGVLNLHALNGKAGGFEQFD